MKNNHSIYTLILVIFLIFLSAITVNAQKDDSTRSKIKAMGTVMVNTPLNSREAILPGLNF